ncbi:hypothetical protein ASPZODRAFT_16172 [Penicilliopsis zonata CBS 506.65]|uniref:SnoaL-like domain-containing protein n=1 Tax=Penicilliopsis zonata CBS 506.65 TaxID=1073090 RepID=A0A1L9SH54_9EURO|nr:hypothetical protein ASPZODRAFT_16172 [Penicilliopsis zonata CBS 506.65]OJJ46404.1 hypothetical protein ASPZODRAFT_16172 [Penicilliopsis zonata CBS 506.65]
MVYYRTLARIEPELGTFINEYYHQMEDNITGDALAAFCNDQTVMTREGSLRGSGKYAIRDAQSIRPNASKDVQPHHFPFYATVGLDNETQKQYRVRGVVKETYPNGTCLANLFGTDFTVEKENGTAQLRPESGSLLVLDIRYENTTEMACEDF